MCNYMYTHLMYLVFTRANLCGGKPEIRHEGQASSPLNIDAASLIG